MIYARVGMHGNRMDEYQTDDDFQYIVDRNVKVLIVPENNKRSINKAKVEQQVNFIAGNMTQTNGKYIRDNESLISRSVIVLDYENITMSEDEFKLAVESGLHDYTYYLYPTISSTSDAPRYRLIVKPERNFNEPEHKWVVDDITTRIGIETGDNSNYTWSQMNGFKITVGNAADYESKCVLNIGNDYPVKYINIDVWRKLHYNDVAQISRRDLISDELSHEIMELFIQSEYENLQDRNNYFSALAAISRAVQTKEISYDNGEKFAQMLSCGDPEWAENNLVHFQNEVKIPKKTNYTFMDKFGFYYKKKHSIEKKCRY